MATYIELQFCSFRSSPNPNHRVSVVSNDFQLLGPDLVEKLLLNADLIEVQLDIMTRGGGRGAARGRGSSSTAGRGVLDADHASLGGGRNIVASGRGSGSIARYDDPGVYDSSEGGRRNGVSRGRGGRRNAVAIGLRDTPIDEFVNIKDEFDIPVNDEECAESSERQARGSNTTQQASIHSSNRQIIVPYGTRFVDPGVGKEIIDIFKSMFAGCWPRWTDVPKANRNLMWERFQAKFQWDPCLQEKVRDNWENILKARYSDIMSEARADAIKEATKRGIDVGDDLTLIKPFFPEWIDEANWAQMIDNVWNTDKWKIGSKANKRNRATLVDGQISVHSGGSLSFDHHRLRMEKERGGPVSELEVFKNFYLKKQKTSSSEEASGSGSPDLVTQRAQKVLDAYMKLVVETYGEDSAHHPININRDLWETAGGLKKGRLFGVPGARGMSSTTLTDAYHTSDLTFDQIQRLIAAEERVTRLEEENKQIKETVDDIRKILEERLPPPPN